ncbi:MAG TPA: SH3 domain-containing protein [Arsenophonus apicola]|jgi:cell wall-associated NlpC family hydrolase|uniref:SH3 domain-containing protein n=1 Tax=Arsenophonus TaxID=637 RepID=UPI0015D82970|nr:MULTISPECIES: SH3 domain-containing protein [Arsenophonus]UBX28425.1 SH3 domain-containing protein [Arsenophonus apicola]
MKKIISFSILLLLIGCGNKTPPTSPSFSNKQDIIFIDQTKKLFPIANYPQNSARWIPPHEPGYRQPFLTEIQQKEAFDNLLARYFGEQSPWNGNYIQSVLQDAQDVSDVKNAKRNLSHFAEKFTAPNVSHYGENFRLLDANWKAKMQYRVSVPIAEHFTVADRGITLRETAVRFLPTAYPAFEDPREAGQGYPFDMLQNSALHPAEPVYIAAVTADKSWSFIISSTVMGWVDSSHIAKANNHFIQQWTAMANKKLAAVINDNASFTDEQGIFRFTARTGTLLPLKLIKGKAKIVLPVSDGNGYAVIRYAPQFEQQVRQVPILPTAENMAHIIQYMQGKDYGWGSLYGFNDCSAEVRNLMLPFGIFLPRNSLPQSLIGKRIDLSDYSTNERIAYLMKYGQPFKTLIYIQGHIMLYVGNSNWQGRPVPIIYHNVWGLRPAAPPSRSIIGQSVFLPLLAQYPDAPELESLASKPLFIISYLDQAE